MLFRSKIPAIKLVRLAAAHQELDPNTGRTFSGIGLREAKEAVEFHLTSIGVTHPDGSPHWHGNGNPAGKLASLQPICRIVCNFGEGEVELDMEGVSLRVLSGLNGGMRIQDALALIDLYKRVKDWEDGLCKPAAGAV